MPATVTRVRRGSRRALRESNQLETDIGLWLRGQVASQSAVEERQNLDAEQVPVAGVQALVGDPVEQAVERQLPVLRGELRQDLGQHSALVPRARRPARPSPHAAASYGRSHRSGTPASGIPSHKVYPYLLRGKTIDQPSQVWAADHNVHCDAIPTKSPAEVDKRCPHQVISFALSRARPSEACAARCLWPSSCPYDNGLHPSF
jgi:hypothetical protein